MDKIPPEIFSQIVNNLDAPLTPYSTISRDWQSHIEVRTMAEIHVRSDNASKLDTTFQDTRRRALLKNLIYEIILPSYNPLRWSKVPGRRECLKNNTVFTQELRSLFTKLRTYEVNGATPFRLDLGVSCAMDTYKPPLSQGQTDGTGDNRNNNTYIYLDPVEQEPLPVLTKIIGFSQRWCRRKLHSTILGLVLRALPAVEEIQWEMSGPDVRLLNLRRDLRTSLAYILSSTSLSSLRVLDLCWEDAQCSNHSFHAGSLLNPETGVDELSVALRRIAQLPTIKMLLLQGSFLLSPEFFYFESPSNASLPPLWPSLEVLKLDLSSMTPAGDWYFTGDSSAIEESDERSYIPGDDSEFVDSSDSEAEDNPAVWDWVQLNGEVPYHPWRTQPDAAFDLFLLALAKSIPQMPALQRLTSEMGFGVARFVVGVEFRAAGEKPRNTQYLFLAHDEDKIHDFPHWDVVLRTQGHEPYDQVTTWKLPEELKQALKSTTGSHGTIYIVNGDQRLEL